MVYYIGNRIICFMNKSHEFSRRALNLSLAIYRVTAKFPAGEVLAWQMRKLGNEVAGDLAENNFANLEKRINRLIIYFSIAKSQGWVKPINWSILEIEYYKLKREACFWLPAGEARAEEKALDIVSHNIGDKKKSAGPKVAAPVRERTNSRQSKILMALDKKANLKMSEIIPLFKNEISERTLRNELQAMVESGLIKKSGLNKFTEYSKR